MRREIMSKMEAWKCSEGRKPLILKGFRQCGKSYLLDQFGRKCFQDSHYLNFEDMRDAHQLFSGNLNPQALLSNLQLYFGKDIDIENDLLIMDEVQECGRAMTSLKYFCEDMPKLAICAAGSLLGVKTSEASFPVGKVTFLEMFPMNFREFIEGIEDQKAVSLYEGILNNSDLGSWAHDYLMNLLKIYYVIGGMPEAINVYKRHAGSINRAFSEVRSVQQALLSGYRADFSKHAGKINANHIERVFENIPRQLSKFSDSSVSKFIFKGVLTGSNARLAKLAGPIDWLCSAGLAHRVMICSKPEHPLIAHCDEKMFKLFLFDVGVLGAMMNLNPNIIVMQDYGTQKGFFVENYVASTLAALGEPLISWLATRAEIEFIRNIAGKLIPNEVKAGINTKSKSLQEYKRKYAPEFVLRTTAKPLNIDKENKTINLPLYLSDQTRPVIPAEAGISIFEE